MENMGAGSDGDKKGSPEESLELLKRILPLFAIGLFIVLLIYLKEIISFFEWIPNMDPSLRPWLCVGVAFVFFVVLFVVFFHIFRKEENISRWVGSIFYPLVICSLILMIINAWKPSVAIFCFNNLPEQVEEKREEEQVVPEKSTRGEVEVVEVLPLLGGGLLDNVPTDVSSMKVINTSDYPVKIDGFGFTLFYGDQEISKRCLDLLVCTETRTSELPEPIEDMIVYVLPVTNEEFMLEIFTGSIEIEDLVPGDIYPHFLDMNTPVEYLARSSVKIKEGASLESDLFIEYYLIDSLGNTVKTQKRILRWAGSQDSQPAQKEPCLSAAEDGWRNYGITYSEGDKVPEEGRDKNRFTCFDFKDSGFTPNINDSGNAVLEISCGNEEQPCSPINNRYWGIYTDIIPNKYTFSVSVDSIGIVNPLEGETNDTNLFIGIGDPFNGPGKFVFFRQVDPEGKVHVCVIGKDGDYCRPIIPPEQYSLGDEIAIRIEIDSKVRIFFIGEDEEEFGENIDYDTPDISNNEIPYLWIGYGFRRKGYISATVEFPQELEYLLVKNDY